MAKEIRSYRVSHCADGRIYIGLHYADGSYSTVQPAGPYDAAFVLDILRNESPVFMDQHGTIYTGAEPAGEGDPTPGGPPPAAV